MTEIHPKLVDALSPSSGLYGALWPMIIAQAPFILRRLTLYNVNRYFRELCAVYHDSRNINNNGDSDPAKLMYIATRFWNLRSRCSHTSPFTPFVIPFSSPAYDVEWYSWNARGCDFRSPQNFARFCALGDIDPDTKIRGPDRATYSTYTWISKGRDLTFQLTIDANFASAPLEIPRGSITITGVADKVRMMYEFVSQGNADWYQLSPGLEI